MTATVLTLIFRQRQEATTLYYRYRQRADPETGRPFLFCGGISTRGQAAGNQPHCNARKNTRQRLTGSGDSPRVIFLRSEKPGERGGAPNSAEIHIHARKGAGPLLAKHIRKSYPNGVRDFFQLCRRSAVKGHPLCHAGAPRRPATAIYKALQAICPATLYRPTGEPAPPAMGMF